MTHTTKQAAIRHARFSRRRRAVLPHLGNFFFGNLFNAITGNKRFPRPLFNRAIANGLNKEQLETVCRQIRDREELAPAMLSIAENQLQHALYWHDVGVKNRARDNYLESAFWELFGSLLLQDAASRAKSLARCRASYALAAPHFVNPAQEVIVDYLGTTLKGYLRLPSLLNSTEEPTAINANHPCVVLFNGISTPKEELYFTENSLLAVGLATFSFDYPLADDGQLLAGLDSEELGNALLFTLAAHPEVDMSRLVAYGSSIGGRIALSVAAKFNERFRAIAALSTPYDLLSDLDLLLPAMRRECAAPPLCSKSTLFDIARQTELRGQLENIEIPALIIGGGKDVIAMPEETRLIYEQIKSSDKKLIVCSGASHNCSEMMPSLRHEIAQWIKQRL